MTKTKNLVNDPALLEKPARTYLQVKFVQCAAVDKIECRPGPQS